MPAVNSLYRAPTKAQNALAQQIVPAIRNALAFKRYADVPSAVQGTFGMSPGMDRLNILPRRDPNYGWVAPQLVYDLASAVLTPSVGFGGGQVTPEDALNFGMNTLGAGVVTSAAKPIPGSVVGANVYHASPHNFDAFDISKIGTGTGRKDFGHGLYVADNAGAAKRHFPQGKLYTADLPDSHIGKMMDWDATLPNQPKPVQESLKKALGNDYADAEKLGYRGSEIYGNFFPNKTEAEMSAYLNSIGIPGIRYADGMNRSNSNFVVFDDRLLKILKKE